MRLKWIAAFSLLMAAFCLFAAEGVSPFRWSLNASAGKVTVSVQVPEKHYLDAGGVRVTGSAGTQELHWIAPAPVRQGETEVYPAGKWVWTAASAGDAAALSVKVEFQGCTTDGVCLMPEEITLSGTSATPAATSVSGDLPPFRVIRKMEGLTDVPGFLAFLQGTSAASAVPVTWLWMILLALAGGLALNFTPCVLPLIPINLAIIGASGRGWKRGLIRASAYGGGMAAAYGILGVLAVLTGARFGSLNSSAWFNFGIAVVFLILGCAMLGLFSLDFTRFAGHISVPGNRKEGGLWVPFLLGAVAALLAGACVAPVLIAVIVFAANVYADGNPAGLLLPFVLGLGMALPWPAAGAGLAVLPRPGAWMNRVKQLLAVLILLAAGYYIYLGIGLLPGKYSPEQEIGKVRTALAGNKPVLIDFWATWCKNCAEMDRSTLRNTQVQNAVRKFEFVKFQAEKLSDPAVKAMLDKCGVSGLPAFVIIEPEPEQ